MRLLHVTVGGGRCLFRAAALLARAQVGRVPVPPVVLGVRLLVAVVALRRLAQQFRKCLDVHGSCPRHLDRKSTRLNSSHANISYAVFCLKKKKNQSSITYLL